MTDRNYTSVFLQSKILENTGHSGTKSETYGRGMQYIFEKPRLSLDGAILNKYTGSYQFPNGNKIELKNENGGLALYFSGDNKYTLYSASETDFYSTAEYFNIQFKPGSDEPGGFQLNRYGNSQFIKKIK